MVTQEYQKGDVIFNYGDESKSIFFVIDGEV